MVKLGSVKTLLGTKLELPGGRFHDGARKTDSHLARITPRGRSPRQSHLQFTFIDNGDEQHVGVGSKFVMSDSPSDAKGRSDALDASDPKILDALIKVLSDDDETNVVPATSSNKLHPAFAVGAGIFCVANVGILLSLPPVLRGRGAPYLPTFQKSVNTMFTQLRKDHHIKRKLEANQHLRFVDLGSGDGRVVFRAAREGIFNKCIGYEINPLLHAWASTRRIFQSRYRSSTEFHLQDLWHVGLTEVDVVAVYGLNPIMKDLGVKLRSELRPGTLVLSNVFAIPGWKQSPLSAKNVHIYSVPSCWQIGKDTETKT